MVLISAFSGTAFKWKAAGSYRITIQMNCTSTALSNPTTKLCSGQPNLIPKYPEQGGVRLKI
jgi:hypothetical protein